MTNLDFIRDVEPVAGVLRAPLVVVVNPSFTPRPLGAPKHAAPEIAGRVRDMRRRRDGEMGKVVAFSGVGLARRGAPDALHGRPT